MIFRAFLSLVLPPLRRVFPPFPYLIYCLSVCFKSLSHMDFSLLTHLPLPHRIPRSLLSSWNWEKSSPVPDTEHQLQAPFLLRFLPCLFSAVSVGNVFTKIIHWIEETDFITIILFVLFKTGKEMERKGLCCYYCYLVLNGVFSPPVLMYPSAIICLYHCSKIMVL